jgi:UDP-N-acetylmuramoyl-L-alanyl-D-glutamate--2,6-diaminopimelate ligase
MNAVARTPVNHGRSFSLRELLHGVVSDEISTHLPDLYVTGLSLDSRACKQGYVFLAVPGLKSHGISYASQAINSGAVVVLWQPTIDVSEINLPMAQCIAIDHLDQKLGILADRFYGHPSQQLKIAGITGTNGKSTTAYLIATAAQRCGIEAGYSGTVGYGRMHTLRPSAHTTPDVVTVHKQLAEMCEDGASAVAMEVSSHALDQGRIADVHIDTAVFTNLTRDHLDYHGSMQAYGDAKRQLFNVPGLRHRVLNIDDPFGRELALVQSTASVTTLYGSNDSISAARFLHAKNIELSDAGLCIEIGGSFGHAVLHSALLGRFNAENLLAALAVLLGWDVPLDRAIEALSEAEAPPGRMELIKQENKRVVVDYAHTPDALQKALQVLKSHCRGRLICVFGCGGDRDVGKRALMGAVAASHADCVVITNDNPRSESPELIIKAIQSGMAGRPAIIEPDRALAIAQAIHMAQPEDMVLVAGKGHEDYQIIGHQVLRFSDREVVRACLRGAA